MKKLLSLLLTAAILAGLLAGCGAAPAAESTAKPVILVTVYPAYDWIKNLLGDQLDQVELRLLLDDGVDLHSYQPTVADLAQIADCDLLVYVGGESDAWIAEAASQARTDQRRASLLELLGDGVREEELSEGMQGEADGAPDEHVWLSVKNARKLCAALTPFLRELGLNARSLDASLADYDRKLEALDRAYEQAVASAERDTLLFADRFPFRYLTEDYGLKYYAAFPGCEAETEASFQTVVFLAGKLDELGLGSVLILETSDGRLARTVIENTAAGDQQILTLHSMQGSCGGESYLTIMERNLETLKAALS